MRRTTKTVRKMALALILLAPGAAQPTPPPKLPIPVMVIDHIEKLPDRIRLRRPRLSVLFWKRRG